MHHIEAMRNCEANVGRIMSLLDEIGNTGQWPRSWEWHGVPRVAQDFLDGMSEVIRRGKIHEIAAAFTFGRENIILSMFKTIVDELDNRMGSLGLFSHYLQRHIDIDGEEHGPLAYRMIKRLCGENVQMLEEVTVAARASLQERITFWSASNFKSRPKMGEIGRTSRLSYAPTRNEIGDRESGTCRGSSAIGSEALGAG